MIEVADETVKSGRNQKIPHYAGAGTHEAWIVNLPKQVVEVHTNPVEGKYTSTRKVGRRLTIAPGALADVVIRVDDFLGNPR